MHPHLMARMGYDRAPTQLLLVAIEGGNVIIVEAETTMAVASALKGASFPTRSVSVQRTLTKAQARRYEGNDHLCLPLDAERLRHLARAGRPRASASASAH
jgi:hypothetical protein